MTDTTAQPSPSVRDLFDSYRTTDKERAKKTRDFLDSLQVAMMNGVAGIRMPVVRPAAFWQRCAKFFSMDRYQIPVVIDEVPIQVEKRCDHLFFFWGTPNEDPWVPSHYWTRGVHHGARYEAYTWLVRDTKMTFDQFVAQESERLAAALSNHCQGLANRSCSC